jgi:hypothetical protein
MNIMKVSADGEPYDINVVFKKYMWRMQEFPEERLFGNPHVEFLRQSFSLSV